MVWITLTELAEQTSFATRSLQYIRQQEPGVLVTRDRGGRTEYKQPDCAANLLKREREIAKREAKPASFEDAKARKMEAEAQLVEMELADRQRRTIQTDVHEEVVGQVGDRLLAVLVNVPGNYSLRLEALGIDAKVAEAVLESISTDLTRALQGTADDLEAAAAAISGDSSSDTDAA